MIQSEFEECQRRAKLYGWGIKQKKDFLQNLAIAAWLKKGGKGIILAYTGFGKTFIAKKITTRFRVKFADEAVVAVVPSTPIHEQWKIAMKPFDNAYVYGISTMTMSIKNVVRDCGLLFVDEVHHAAGADSQYHNKVYGMVNARMSLGMTATLSKQQEAYLKDNYGLEVAWEITLEEGRALGIIPKYLVCNIGVDLNDGERNTYGQVNRNYRFYLSKFSAVDQERAWTHAMACSIYKNKDAQQTIIDLYTELGLDAPDIKTVHKWGRKFSEAQKFRNNIIYRCHAKHMAVMFLLNAIHRNIIVFTTTTKILHWWMRPNAVMYHSKMKVGEKRMSLKAFCNTANIILSAQALIEGYDKKEAEVAILHDYTRNNKDQEQIIGRVLRPDENNPEKFAVIINLYCKSFMYQYDNSEVPHEIVPQDQKRLKSAQRRLKDVEEVTLNELLQRI